MIAITPENLKLLQTAKEDYQKLQILQDAIYNNLLNDLGLVESDDVGYNLFDYIANDFGMPECVLNALNTPKE